MTNAHTAAVHLNALQIFHANFNVSDLDVSRAFYESLGLRS
jgi:predicted lactoylglutathione lyase